MRGRDPIDSGIGGGPNRRGFGDSATRSIGGSTDAERCWLRARARAARSVMPSSVHDPGSSQRIRITEVTSVFDHASSGSPAGPSIRVASAGCNETANSAPSSTTSALLCLAPGSHAGRLAVRFSSRSAISSSRSILDHRFLSALASSSPHRVLLCQRVIRLTDGGRHPVGSSPKMKSSSAASAVRIVSAIRKPWPSPSNRWYVTSIPFC